MSDARIGVAIDGAVGRIEIRRPEKKNALDSPMAAAISAGLAGFESDPACKVVVISGQGGDLSAGADLSEVRTDRSDDDDFSQHPHATMLRSISESRLPVVALVDGWAIGMGLGIVGAATFAVAGAAARFSLPESKLGYIPFAVVPYLSGRVPVETVALWSLSARVIGVDEALANHLVTHASTSESAESVVAPILEELTARPRQIVEDAVGFIRHYRTPTLRPFVEWCDVRMAEVSAAPADPS